MTTYNSNTVTTTRQVSGDTSTSTTINVDSTTTYSRQMGMVEFMYLGVGLFIVIFAILGFIKSIRSRKYYKCPVCGESFRSENMNSETCKVCGANLERTDDGNITDKTK